MSKAYRVKLVGMRAVIRYADNDVENLVGPLSAREADDLAATLKLVAKELREIALYQQILKAKGLIP